MKVSRGAIAGFVLLSGCGGGGGGSPAPVVVPATGQSVVVTAAQGALLYQGAQADAAPAVVSSPARAAGRALDAWLAQYAIGAFEPAKQPAIWTPITGTGFYFEAGPTTLTTTSILLSTNGTSNNAGSITLSLKTVPGQYPTVIGEQNDIILPSQTITGAGTLTLADSSGKDFTQTVFESATPSDVSVQLTSTVVAGLITAESFSVTHGTLTVTFTALTPYSNDYTAGLTVGNISGALVSYADGSGSASTKDASGTWNLAWDANLNATLTSPTGKVTTGALGTFPLSGG